MNPRLHASLRLVFWASIAELGLSAASLLLSLVIRATNDWRFWLNVESTLLGVGYLGALLVLGAAALKLTGPEASRGGRGLALAAAISFGALALFKPLDVYQSLSEAPLALVGHEVVRWVRVGLSNAATMLLGLSIFRAALQLKVRAPIELFAGAVLLSLGGLALSLADLDGLGEWRWYLHSALGAVESGLVIAYVHVCRTRLGRLTPGDAPGVPTAADPEWATAAEGLAAYAGAVKFRLVFAIIAAPIAALAGRSSDLGAVKAVVALSVVASVITGAVIIHGLLRFARMPGPADGTPASLAASLVGFGFLFEAWTLTLALRLDTYSVGAAFDFMKQAPIAEAGAQVCGAFALLSVLAAIKNAATARGSAALVDRASVVGWMLAGGGLALAVLKAVATSVRDAAPVLLLLGVPLLIVMLVGLVRFFGVLTDAVGLLQPVAHGEPPAPPAAGPT